jgi:hypothetical protein
MRKDSPRIKSWQKLAPDTIESWLISDEERDHRLADEALQRLGDNKAREYLHTLLENERDAKARSNRNIAIGFLVSSVLLGILIVLTIGAKFLPLANVVAFMSWIIGPNRYGKVSKLQIRLADHVLKNPDVNNLKLLLLVCQTVWQKDLNYEIVRLLPNLYRQITPQTKHLLPDDFWKSTVEGLKFLAREKKLTVSPDEQDSHRAYIELCGNIRYEPALPHLEAIASMDAKTPQAIELRQLAAKYVAIWHQPVTVVTAPVIEPEKTPLIAGKWYAS